VSSGWNGFSTCKEGIAYSSGTRETYGADRVSQKASSGPAPCPWPVEKGGIAKSPNSPREGRQSGRYGAGAFELR
jgi:hypothetical protein